MSDERTPLREVREGMLVRHFGTGGTYAVVGLARFTHGHAVDQVVYRSRQDGRLWIRPLPEFLWRFEECGEGAT